MQLRVVPAAAPVQDAVNVLAPWEKLTVVAQLAAEAEHGKFVPVTLNAKLDNPAAAEAAEGVRELMRGKEELVVSISRTFWR